MGYALKNDMDLGRARIQLADARLAPAHPRWAHADKYVHHHHHLHCHAGHRGRTVRLQTDRQHLCRHPDRHPHAGRSVRVRLCLCRHRPVDAGGEHDGGRGSFSCRFSGTNFPAQSLPYWLIPISLMLPLTYGSRRRARIPDQDGHAPAHPCRDRHPHPLHVRDAVDRVADLLPGRTAGSGPWERWDSIRIRRKRSRSW
ncbi:MAG: hypothetical protein MZV64_59545 [Ignavibacteriales bacterium]|nr:hypothetical protein [Ignavibacteriales bacterium]